MSQDHKHTPQAGDETSAGRERRVSEGFYAKYIDNKQVLDIGPGHTPIAPHAKLWDHSLGDEDCTYMSGLANSSFDTVYSSHVLEHLPEPQVALENWLRLVKPGGYLIVSVPDEDLYEQEIWPPIFNPDHRYSYTLYKSQSWNGENSKNLVEMIMKLEGVKLVSARIVDTNYDYSLKFIDQRQAEKSVEVIVQRLGLMATVKASLYTGFSCFCGCLDMRIIGMYITGEILLQCMDCKHYSKAQTAKLLQDVGYKLEPPKSS